MKNQSVLLLHSGSNPPVNAADGLSGWRDEVTRLKKEDVNPDLSSADSVDPQGAADPR